MLEIHNKTIPDSVAKIPMVNAHMRWILDASEEVIGLKNLTKILEEQNLGHLSQNYPEENMRLSDSLIYEDYANLCCAIMARDISERRNAPLNVGRVAAKPALERQGQILKFAGRQAIKLLPMSLQVKTVLDSIQSDIRKVKESHNLPTHLRVENRGAKWAYIDEECPLCAGKTSTVPICQIWNGTIQESLYWLVRKEFRVEQTTCRAMGDKACIWEVEKAPS